MSPKSLTILGALLRLSTLAFGAPTPAPSEQQPIDFLSQKAPWRLLPLTNDTEFDFELYLALDEATGRGASPGDVLTAASYIKPGDFESFANTFWSLANQTVDAARELAKSPDPISARASFFAASTYFRAADFYLHGDPTDPRLSQLWHSQLDAFGEGIKRMRPVPGRRIQIPTSYNFTVDGYYYAVDGSCRPTFIIGTGYDTPQEDLLFPAGIEAMNHGWNVLTYEGPGQPTVIHEQGVGFIPEWERVLSPVIDWLEHEPSNDMSQLTLLGLSLGGYLNARAAAYEPRIKALILNSGLDDFYSTFTRGISPQLLDLLGRNNTAFDEYVTKTTINNQSAPTTSRWLVNQGLYTFNTRSPAEYFEKSRAYNDSSFIGRIQIPTFLINATEDKFLPGGSDVVAAQLRKNNSHVTEVTIGGVGAQHDQPGASLEMNRLIWSWMNSIWKPAVV